MRRPQIPDTSNKIRSLGAVDTSRPAGSLKREIVAT
jgi:hypothetical protein